MPFPKGHAMGFPCLGNLIPHQVHWPLSMQQSVGQSKPQLKPSSPTLRSRALIKPHHTERPRNSSSCRLNLVWQKTIQLCSHLPCEGSVESNESTVLLMALSSWRHWSPWCSTLDFQANTSQDVPSQIPLLLRWWWETTQKPETRTTSGRWS